MKLEKIDNPNWVANIAPDVMKLVDKILLPNINFHSLIVHFQNVAQFGGKQAELWVATSEATDIVPAETLGFASWAVRHTPYVGTVYLEWIYSKRIGVAEALLRQFEQFAMENNAPFFMCDLVNNGKLAKHFSKIIAKEGYKFIEAPYLSYVARKQGEAT